MQGVVNGVAQQEDKNGVIEAIKEPLPQPLSKERGVICSPIVFYLLSISKAFYSPLLGEGLGVRLCFRLFSLRLQYNFPFVCKRLHCYFLILFFYREPTYD